MRHKAGGLADQILQRIGEASQLMVPSFGGCEEAWMRAADSCMIVSNPLPVSSSQLLDLHSMPVL